MTSSHSALSEATQRYRRRQKWQRRVGLVLALVSVVPTSLYLWVMGYLPASAPPMKGAFTQAEYKAALEQVDRASGSIDLTLLTAHREHLDRYLDELATVSPLNAPTAFQKPEEQLAYWLNAYHAMVLQELVDGWPVKNVAELSRHTRTWPLGGSRLTRYAIERRFLRPAEDARVWLALFTGARGSGRLSQTPFDGPTLNAQLNDAARRFIRRRENVRLEGTQVMVSQVFHEHQAEFLAALAPERQHILQVVWAFLPDTCEGEYPGCVTRADLDKACGATFGACTVTYSPVDPGILAN